MASRSHTSMEAEEKMVDELFHRLDWGIREDQREVMQDGGEGEEDGMVIGAGEMGDWEGDSSLGGSFEESTGFMNSNAASPSMERREGNTATFVMNAMIPISNPVLSADGKRVRVGVYNQVSGQASNSKPEPEQGLEHEGKPQDEIQVPQKHQDQANTRNQTSYHHPSPLYQPRNPATATAVSTSNPETEPTVTTRRPSNHFAREEDGGNETEEEKERARLLDEELDVLDLNGRYVDPDEALKEAVLRSLVEFSLSPLWRDCLSCGGEEIEIGESSRDGVGKGKGMGVGEGGGEWDEGFCEEEVRKAVLESRDVYWEWRCRVRREEEGMKSEREREVESWERWEFNRGVEEEILRDMAGEGGEEDEAVEGAEEEDQEEFEKVGEVTNSIMHDLMVSERELKSFASGSDKGDREDPEESYIIHCEEDDEGDKKGKDKEEGGEEDEEGDDDDEDIEYKDLDPRVVKQILKDIAALMSSVNDDDDHDDKEEEEDVMESDSDTRIRSQMLTDIKAFMEASDASREFGKGAQSEKKGK